MKTYVLLMTIPLFMLVNQLASAGSMPCGRYLIEDDQINSPTRSDIEEKCGTPDSSSGDNWYYKKDDVTYQLHFNDSNELESITEEIK